MTKNNPVTPLRVSSLPVELLTDILEDLPSGVLVFTPVHDDQHNICDFRYLAANKLALRIVRQDVNDLLGARMLELFPAMGSTGLFDKLRNVMETKQPQSFEQFIPAESSVWKSSKWYAMNAKSHNDMLVVTLEDITQRKQLEEYIKKMAFQDELTGIYNRRYFLARTPQLLSLAARQDWSCALLYFDLNGFKQVNDTCGHSAGDKLLQAIAWRLGSISRDGDIFFRSGGDEFALFLTKATDKTALRTAERIAAEFTRPFLIDTTQHHIGVSIGVIVMPSGEATVDRLLEWADRAMYDAKARKQQEPIAISYWSGQGSDMLAHTIRY